MQGGAEMSAMEVLPPWMKSYYFRPGYLLPTTACKDTIETVVRDFEIKDDDVFLLTYPRSGTMWINAILDAIFHKDDLSALDRMDMHQKLATIEFGPTTHDPDMVADGIVVPKSFIELWVNDKPSPRVLHSHLYIEFLPQQWFKKKPKTVYVRRDPKDVLVSMAEHHKSAKYLGQVTWEKYFNEFLDGNADWGCAFTHTKHCAAYMNEPWWLCLTYEETHRDHGATVQKIADFLGISLSDKQVKDIVRVTSFKEMKKVFENTKTVYYEEGNAGMWHRKGQIGDWKNAFTDAQNEAFDKVYAEKMKGYEQLMYKY